MEPGTYARRDMLRELEVTKEYLHDVRKQLDRELQARQDDAVFIDELTRECAGLRSSLNATTADLHAAQMLNTEVAGERIREDVCTASALVRECSESRSTCDACENVFVRLNEPDTASLPSRVSGNSA
ncbi:hypothetical protein CSUI_005404 [Cystoisospora suis]|uniref:Uncharacterized protein n=1 Tax=Cystoisospora suis TaxID=483139 RepID=A0A2C6KXP5_9APIC|nr:hypothetical protein CSUI_005404 [Cystoisospora suis]